MLPLLLLLLFPPIPENHQCLEDMVALHEIIEGLKTDLNRKDNAAENYR